EQFFGLIDKPSAALNPCLPKTIAPFTWTKNQYDPEEISIRSQGHFGRCLLMSPKQPHHRSRLAPQEEITARDRSPTACAVYWSPQDTFFCRSLTSGHNLLRLCSAPARSGSQFRHSKMVQVAEGQSGHSLL